MLKVKILYTDNGASGIDIDRELDDEIREFFEGLGFVWTGQGFDIQKAERDICLESGTRKLCRMPEEA